jgi:hypothetical protein
MTTALQPRAMACLTRIQRTTQSRALILMTPQGRIIARVGVGTDEQAADLSAAVARVVRRRSFSAAGPVWWFVLETAVLVMCDKRGMDKTLNAAAMEPIEDLKRLLRSAERILQTTRAPWCMI